MDKEAPAIGIDVSKHKLDVALLVDGKVRSKSVTNSPAGYQELTVWMTKQKVVLDECLVSMESTGVYSEPVALGLQALGLTVSIVNPARIKGFGQSELVRNKNDGIDAALIARYCAMMHPAPWQAPPPEQRRLRAWCDRLKALKDMRQQEENRLEACKTVANSELEVHIQQHVAWLSSQIKQIERDIDDHIDRHPSLKRDAALMASIPGIGRATVAVMLSHVGDLHRFSSAKALAAHLGVSPRQRVSGTSVRGRSTMSRTGALAGRRSPSHCFWSSTRGTILPRSMDERSDIDYMIVFSENNATPQTYLNRLRAFVEKYYRSSDIRQSSPTIVLELNHIKFDLVPATTTWLGELQIPDDSGCWMTTTPNDFNATLEANNKDHKSLIKPTIRLFKYWNATAGFPFQSFEMEKWVCGLSFWFLTNQKDYLLAVIESLNTSSSYSQWVNNEITRAKNIVAKVRQYEKDDMPVAAESEIKKLFRL